MIVNTPRNEIICKFTSSEIISWTEALFDNLDFMIVRENTEEMYKQDEEELTDEGAIAKRIITRKAETRIVIMHFNMLKTWKIKKKKVSKKKKKIKIRRVSI